MGAKLVRSLIKQEDNPGLCDLAYTHLLPTTPTTDSSVVVFKSPCPLQRKQTKHLANPNRDADLAASPSRVPNAAGEWRFYQLNGYSN